jgi:hypothetical protein
MNGPLGLKMSDEEISSYMNDLVQGKFKVADATEAACLSQWRELTTEIGKAHEMLNRAKAEIEKMTATIQQMHGGRTALVRILIASEEGRRNDANPNLKLIKNEEKKGEAK